MGRKSCVKMFWYWVRVLPFSLGAIGRLVTWLWPTPAPGMFDSAV